MTTPSNTSRVRSFAGVAVAAALVLVSCGGSSDDAAADSADAGAAEAVEFAPVEVDGEALPPYAASVEDPTIGAAAPVVTGVSIDGTPLTIGAPTGNPTFLAFLAHWCPACQAELPVLAELAATDGYPAGLDVLAVATASTPERDNYPPSEWFDSTGWTLPTLADSAAAEAFTAFGGASFPYLVVLDADGTVLARKDGAASAAETVAFLEQALSTATG